MSRPRLIALLLALGTLVVFLPTGWFGFVNYDDPDYVTENIFVKNGLNGTDIAQAFTSFHAANWHPLTWISHMIDCSLFGLNPGAMHFVNVLFHAANTALLFTLLLRLTKKIWPSAFIAALFAWHPLHIQSVAWISERKDVLSTFFGLLTLIAYARFAQEQRARSKEPTPNSISHLPSPISKSYWLALIFFALGLMAKQMLVTLPFVMLLLDFWPLQRWQISNFKFQIFAKLFAEKIPFFLLVIPACVLTCLAQRAAMSSLERLPFPLRLENSVVTYALYLLKLFWPVNLAFFYPLTGRSPANLAIASLTLATISFLTWRTRRAQPYVLVGWLWFLGTLVPVIGLVQVGEQSMADRYSYLPSVGIFIIVTFGGLALAERFAFVKKILAPAAILIIAGCVFATEIQLQYWRTDETLFSHAIAVTSDNEIAHLNLGVVYEKQGRTAEAMNEYRAALKINPRRAHTHNNIADLLDAAGQPDAARAEYLAALQLDPNALEAHLNYGILLVELNRFDEAAEQFKLAAALEPTDARPHYQLGKLLLKRGDDVMAIGELRLALQNDPNDFQMLAYTARVFAADENAVGRNGATALELASRANDLTGGEQPFVLDALGMAYAETGDFTNAVACAQNALARANAAQMSNVAPLQKRLELYQQNQPWRESFRATNAPATR
ncbi:MAG TPA: tetratricopeptide repeat protein [Verrucomicrobiae bacterium]